MARNLDNTPDLAINRIVEGTTMEGTIRSEGNIRIDGAFNGDIHTKGRLVVGPSGKIDGTVHCQNSEVEGFIKGKITVEQMLSLKGSAKIEGDILTDKLSIEPGAMFTGTCSMGSKVKDIQNLDKTAGPKAKILEEQTA